MFAKKPRRIDGYDLESPAGWHPLPLRQADDGWVDQLTSQAAIEGGVSTLAEAVRRVSDEVGRSDALAAAVWVPEAASGEIRAVLGVSFVEPDEGVPFTPEQLGLAVQDAVQNGGRPGLHVHSGDVHLMTLPAGESVLQREIVSETGDGAVEERIVFTVFPPGAAEAVELSFVSPHLESGEELAAHAVAVAQSLIVRLA